MVFPFGHHPPGTRTRHFNLKRALAPSCRQWGRRWECAPRACVCTLHRAPCALCGCKRAQCGCAPVKATTGEGTKRGGEGGGGGGSGDSPVVVWEGNTHGGGGRRRTASHTNSEGTGTLQNTALASACVTRPAVAPLATAPPVITPGTDGVRGMAWPQVCAHGGVVPRSMCVCVCVACSRPSPSQTPPMSGVCPPLPSPCVLPPPGMGPCV